MPDNKASTAPRSDVGEKGTIVQTSPSTYRNTRLDTDAYDLSAIIAGQACARDDQRQKAEHDLIQSWQARLQLISVIVRRVSP